MKISFAITVCNEFTEIQKLMDLLLRNKKIDDEIIILFDLNNGTQEVENYLKLQESLGNCKLTSDYFWDDFAEWKNKLNLLCSGDFIFQLDADELISDGLFEILYKILESNPEVDAFLIPRLNIVDDITYSYIESMGWVYENDRINWPDYQTRLYRNDTSIKWKRRVHESIEGYKHYSIIPSSVELALIHHKSFEKQQKQNKYYDRLCQR